MSSQTFLEFSALFIYADLLSTALALDEPTMAFSVKRDDVTKHWVATFQMGDVREQVTNSTRNYAVHQLAELLRLRLAQANDKRGLDE